jgi:hypothetical protein
MRVKLSYREEMSGMKRRGLLTNIANRASARAFRYRKDGQRPVRRNPGNYRPCIRISVRQMMMNLACLLQYVSSHNSFSRDSELYHHDCIEPIADEHVLKFVFCINAVYTIVFTTVRAMIRCAVSLPVHAPGLDRQTKWLT